MGGFTGRPAKAHPWRKASERSYRDLMRQRTRSTPKQNTAS